MTDMTENERQQVIQALDWLQSSARNVCAKIELHGWTPNELQDAIKNADAALAIMRRERKPVAYWNFREGFSHCMTDALDEAAKNGPAPLYKD
jgi:predicted exporter